MLLKRTWLRMLHTGGDKYYKTRKNTCVLKNKCLLKRWCPYIQANDLLFQTLQHQPYAHDTGTSGGLKEMSSILADQYRPRIWAQRGGGGRVAGPKPMSTGVCTWSPYKLWRSNSIFNLWGTYMRNGIPTHYLDDDNVRKLWFHLGNETFVT